MDNLDRERLKIAFNDLAMWLMGVSERIVPLRPCIERGALLSSIVMSNAGKLSGADLAAFFAGAAFDRIITSLTAEDVRDIDDALVELNWFIPARLSRALSLSLHPHPLVLHKDQRYARCARSIPD